MERAIDAMAAAIAAILKGKVWGVWLYGSVALEDFRLGWSDIDFVALSDGPLPEEQARRLLTLRQELSAREPGNPYYRAFEGVIADRGEFLRGSFTRLVYWGTSGQRVTDRYTPDAFSLYELAKFGRAVRGDHPWELPAPNREELRRAVRAHYGAIRKYAARTDESLYSCGWLLDIARCVYTLRHGGVIAKTRAGEWALEERVFPDDGPLRRALEIRKSPLAYRDREDVKAWLRSLGPCVQRYADALEKELRRG